MGNCMGRRLVHRQCITDMLCMTLGASLTGIGYAQKAKGLHMYCQTARMSLTEALCLIVSSTGKVWALRCYAEIYW